MGFCHSIMISFVFLSICVLTQVESFLYQQNNVCKNISDYHVILNSQNCWYNPDVFAKPRILAMNHGYPFESYDVITEDDYVLKLFRIPNRESKKPPILMMHGIFVDATTFMTTGKNSPAFYLASKGYDVWLGNARGSFYSTHLKYKPFNPKYWDFSFHEMGIHDIPAFLEFVSAKTGKKGEIALLGYSMGSSSSYSYLSLKPEHAQKHIATVISLAPVSFMENVISPFKILAIYWQSLKRILGPLSNLGIGKNIQPFLDLAGSLCSSYPGVILCEILTETFLGTNEIRPEDIPVVSSHSLSGLSFKTLIHYAQLMTSTGFHQFDYGNETNLKIYNSTLPPDYPVENIQIPTHLFYGEHDILANKDDVILLYNALKTQRKEMISTMAKDNVFYGHSDFSAGKRTERLFDAVDDSIESDRKDKLI